MPKKKEETIEQIEFPDEYKVCACDLSLKRPGICILSLKKTDKGIEITNVQLSSVDNKTDKKKTHGQLLDEIGAEFKRIYPLNSIVYCVREKGIMHQMTPAERSLSKVEGLLDWTLWAFYGQEWFDIYPVTVKKLIAGSGKAEKEDVAIALEKYIGKQKYKCDDESDAAAVGIAWLIQQGQLKEIV